jgi:protein-L-isoaspartate O-methyltransferase
VIDWQTRAHRLVEELTAQGALTDPAWQAAFEAIPRHLFVPCCYDDDEVVGR